LELSQCTISGPSSHSPGGYTGGGGISLMLEGAPEAFGELQSWPNENMGKTWEKTSNIRKSVTEVFILKKFSSSANRSMETLEGQSFVCRDKSIDCDASLVGRCWWDYQEKYLGEWGLRRVDYQLDTSLV
jgi:hypothetical protein